MIAALVATLALAHPASAGAAAGAPPTRVPALGFAQDRYKGLHRQLQNNAAPIAQQYPRAATIGLAVVVVPDPLVPRYRRPYDLSITALELGMMKDGYVLDRYAFPWADELRGMTPDTGEAPAPAKPRRNPSAAAEAAGINSGSYGLMIFRCDAWRGDACGWPAQRTAGQAARPALDAVDSAPEPETHIRALYIVSETATSGVATHQLRCALRKIDAQTRPTRTPPAPDSCPVDASAEDYSSNTRILEYPAFVCATGAPNIVVLGPNFSGTMDSIGAAVDGMFPNSARRICLIASAATDATNGQATSAYPAILYGALALDDRQKIRHVAELAQRLQARVDADKTTDIAILAEASTFGYGVCSRTSQGDLSQWDSATRDLVERFCAAPKFYFPPTIADIRYGVQQLQAQEASELAGAVRRFEDDQHLSLEVAAENGSEFPESQQSAVTAAGIQLQLDRLFGELTGLGPKIVVVAATDVRDRLFLFDQLRAKLPRAMLVDLEADNLLAHPEFLHASRGALAVASVNLTAQGTTFGCEHDSTDSTRTSWSTDAQGLLADSVARLYETGADPAFVQSPCPLSADAAVRQNLPRRAALQVVTFNGFRPISRPFPWLDAEHRQAPPQASFRWLPLTEYSAVLLCVAVPGVWLWPWWLQGARLKKPVGEGTFGESVAHQAGRERRILLVLAACCIPFIVLSVIVAYESTLEVSHPLTYWVGAIEAIGVVALWRCYEQIRQTLWSAHQSNYSGCRLALVLASIALFFTGTAIHVSNEMGVNGESGDAPLMDPTLMNELGFDPTSGLGLYLVIALAVLATLYASAIVATRTWIVRRDFHLLTLACAYAPGAETFVQAGSQDPVEGEAPMQGESRMQGESPPHVYRPLPTWPVVLLVAGIIFTLAAPGLLDELGGPRLTVFGPFAARVAVLALSATTLCTAILLLGVYGAGRRIRMLCGYVRSQVLQTRAAGGPRSSAGIPGLWAGGAETPVTFPATPVLARPVSANPYGRGTQGRNAVCNPAAEQLGAQWARLLSECLYAGQWDSRHRLALFAVLAAEMSLFRWIALGAVLCAFAGVMIVYLYPIEADTLLIANLALLAATGVLCAYLAVVFEGDEILSNVLCNRPKKSEVSVGLFTFIASPFLALAGAIVVIGLPGVVDWAGGVYAMLRALGVHS